MTEIPNRGSRRAILLRESYRENGKVKNITIANLTHCNPVDIEAIRFALKHKQNLEKALAATNISITEGKSIGAVWTILQTAAKLGIHKALGSDHNAKLAMWQIIARIIGQGSRLSAVRLAQVHSVDPLGFTKGFDENDLYGNLSWLADNQENIEKRLFEARRKNTKPELFLYDVTSSYLEGEQNVFAQFGYNRDRKNGKKQIVVGLLCDGDGEPVSIEVFAGNTNDTVTFASQIEKVKKRFGCEHVTLVGDKGMIKRTQMESLSDAGLNYITSITKLQIETLVRDGVVQLSMFEDEVVEVIDGGVRYMLRRNPERAVEMENTRCDKVVGLLKTVEKLNGYLADHPRASAKIAFRNVAEKLSSLRIGQWARVEICERELSVRIDEASLLEESRLDGCYAIKTDLPAKAADKNTIHDRYKDLSDVEWAFRTMKIGHLEVRPVFVRTEASTRGHVLVVMLSYLVVRELRRAWSKIDVTVEEGLRSLSTLSSMELELGNGGRSHVIPKPRELSERLLSAAGVRMPEALPCTGVKVVMRRKLVKRRKKN